MSNKFIFFQPSHCSECSMTHTPKALTFQGRVATILKFKLHKAILFGQMPPATWLVIQLRPMVLTCNRSTLPPQENVRLLSGQCGTARYS